MHWLYVYYRLPLAQEAVVQAAASALFARLREGLSSRLTSSLQTALLRRPELRDSDITFMEVYGPLQEAEFAVLESELPRYLQDQPILASAARHSEHFIGLPCV